MLPLLPQHLQPSLNLLTRQSLTLAFGKLVAHPPQQIRGYLQRPESYVCAPGFIDCIRVKAYEKH